MALGFENKMEIIEIMEGYLLNSRPPEEVRNKVDINYKIEGQSIIVFEISPVWNNPKKILTLGYAKATFVKNKNVWKIFWKRADNKWHSYKPTPIVGKLNDFLKLVDRDEYGCFKG